jgi:hypothetical protein
MPYTENFFIISKTIAGTITCSRFQQEPSYYLWHIFELVSNIFIMHFDSVIGLIPDVQLLHKGGYAPKPPRLDEPHKF